MKIETGMMVMKDGKACDEWKTQVARAWRKVYGGTRCDASAFEFAAEVAELTKAAERERWMEAVMAELDGNGQAHAIVTYATKA